MRPTEPSVIRPPEALRFGKYRLVERIGKGGMAEVWRATIAGPGGFERTLVVKRVLPELAADPQFAQMFLAEARLSARLSHPNIVQVFELGEEAGSYFLAMEHVRGVDLVSVLHALVAREAVPPGLGATVMRDVCRALAYAHALTDEAGTPLRIVHRDVSPSNIMLSFDGAVKLVDFGIAKALGGAGDQRTQTGTLKGKFGYMAPEQVEGAPADHRADLFAAGIVLWEALTARRLFRGENDLQTIALVRQANVTAPSLSNPAVPPELDRICLRALARRFDERYPSCEEMAIDLDRVVHELGWGPEKLRATLRELFPEEASGARRRVPAAPMLPTVPETPSPSVTRARRRPLAVFAAAGLLALGGGGAWLATRARHRVPAPPAVETAPAAEAAPAPAPKPAHPAASSLGPPAIPPPSRPAPPPTVHVRIGSTPPGAEVFLDGESAARGRTPLVLPLLRSESRRALTVKLRGWLPQTVEVIPDSDAHLDLALKRAHAPAPAHHHHHAAPATVAHTPAAPNVEQGDIADPFAH